MKHAIFAALALACSAFQAFAGASVPSCDRADCPLAHGFSTGLAGGLTGLAFLVVAVVLAGLVMRRICASL